MVERDPVKVTVAGSSPARGAVYQSVARYTAVNCASLWFTACTKIKHSLSVIIMYYVYVLQSLKDKKLYIGYTANLRRRLKEHKHGGSESTKKRLPFRLIFYEAFILEEVICCFQFSTRFTLDNFLFSSRMTIESRLRLL